MTLNFSERLFLADPREFNDLAFELFQLHLKYNPVYAEFVKLLDKDITKITECHQIPFIPVELFKTRKLLLQNLKEHQIFESSSTTGIGVSRHYIPDLTHYRNIALSIFEHFYGPVSQYAIFGLLPGYLERSNSSLVFMVDHLMQQSGNAGGFYMQQHDEMLEALANVPADLKVLIFGVTWALLDFSKIQPRLPKDAVIIETGGMKGRKKELIRDELHAELKYRLGVNQICSEYGMTELQSMAYAFDHGQFQIPPTMNVYISDKNDPFEMVQPGISGRINIIDLANHQTCPFISTSDLGKINPDGTFEVLGRTDLSDVRGCSLLAL